jgi:hypothetical protein
VCRPLPHLCGWNRLVLNSMHSSPTRPDPGQIPGLALSVMLLVASVLVLVMSVSSAFNTQPEKWFSHPDEYLHRAAARYYVDHWLPPKVGHPATLDSYSREYGLSYLNEPDIVYFLTGKFAVLLSPVLEADPAFRLFNVLLFFALAVYCSRRREAALIFLPLVLSPQLWYMFSYFNGDAFPLFISILLAFQLAVPSSAFGKSLDGGEARKTLWGVVLLGALIGVLFLSKRNYYFFLAAVPVVIAFRLFGVAPGVVISLATFARDRHVPGFRRYVPNDGFSNRGWCRRNPARPGICQLRFSTPARGGARQARCGRRCRGFGCRPASDLRCRSAWLAARQGCRDGAIG